MEDCDKLSISCGSENQKVQHRQMGKFSNKRPDKATDDYISSHAMMLSLKMMNFIL